MNRYAKKYIFSAFIFILIQVYLLNQIMFASYINPYLYIILIISLPKNTPKWYLLINGFIVGFLIDIFSGTIGYHSTACVLISFIKPWLTKITIPTNILNDQDELVMHKVGFRNFILYSSILTIIHHGSLFFIEHVSFDLFFNLILKIILSSLITIILIIITQLLYYKKE